MHKHAKKFSMFNSIGMYTLNFWVFYILVSHFTFNFIANLQCPVLLVKLYDQAGIWKHDWKENYMNLFARNVARVLELFSTKFTRTFIRSNYSTVQFILLPNWHSNNNNHKWNRVEGIVYIALGLEPQSII